MIKFEISPLVSYSGEGMNFVDVDLSIFEKNDRMVLERNISSISKEKNDWDNLSLLIGQNEIDMFYKQKKL